MSYSEVEFTQKLVDFFVVGLSKIALQISDKEFVYEKNQIETFINQKEQKLLYLIETEHSVLLINNEDDKRLFESLSTLTAVIKKVSEFNLELNINEQLIIVNLPNERDELLNQSNVDNLKLLLKYGVGSYFDLLQNNKKLNGYSQKTIDLTKSKITRLIADIQNLQGTIQIPDLFSMIPDNVQKWLDTNQTTNDSVNDEQSACILNDSKFNDSLNQLVTSWMRSIKLIIDHEPVNGTVLDEILFWNEKESALLAIKQKLESPIINLILDFIKPNTRLYASFTLLINTSLKESLKLSSSYNDFLKNIKVNEFNSANSLAELSDACDNIFEQFRRIKFMKYPVEKAIYLVKVINIDFETKFINIISKSNLFSIEENDFLILLESVQNQLHSYDLNLRAFINVSREVLRKRDAQFISVKIEPPSYITEIMLEIRGIRDSHKDFASSILRLITNLDTKHKQILECQQFYEETQTSFDFLIKLSMKNLFRKDISLLNFHKKSYFQQISVIEEKIVNLLKSILTELTDNPDELFRFFEKFQFLLNKPQVRIMLQDFHSILLATTEEEMKHIEYQVQYQLDIRELISLRNIPKFSSKLLWIKQILHLVNRLFYHLELILTKDWANYPEGKKFYSKLSHLLNEISLDDITEVWINDINRKIGDKILKNSIMKLDSTIYAININLNDLELHNELYCVRILGIEVPKNILLYSEKIGIICEYASGLGESLRSFYEIKSQKPLFGNFLILLESSFLKLERFHENFSKLSWSDILKGEEIKSIGVNNSNELEVLTLAKDYQLEVFQLSENVTELLIIKKKIDCMLEFLSVCEYSFETIENCIREIQNELKTVITKYYENKSDFISAINEKLMKILNIKCKQQISGVISQWNSEGKGFLYNSKLHQVTVSDFSIDITPSIDDSENYFLNNLNTIISVVKQQKKITESAYVLIDGVPELYFDCVLPDLLTLHEECRILINQKCEASRRFIMKWKSAQILWELDVSLLKEELGENLTAWLDYWKKLDIIHSIFNIIDVYSWYGLIKISYEKAQTILFAQFNLCLKSILPIFAEVFQIQASKMLEELESLKVKLLSISMDLSTPSTIVAALAATTAAKNYLVDNENIIYELKLSFQILARYRYSNSFTLSIFETIDKCVSQLSEKVLLNSEFQKSHLDLIKSMLEDENEKLKKSVKIERTKWTNQKPGENLLPEDAISILQIFEKRFSELKRSFDELFLAANGTAVFVSISIKDVYSEIKDLEYVWSIIMKLNNTMDSIKNFIWGEFQCSKMQVTLENALISARSLPSEIRSYPALENAYTEIKNMLKLIPSLSFLQSDCILEHHWHEIFSRLLMKPMPTPLLVGDVISLDLVKNEKYIKSVAHTAESEQNLKNSLDDIERSWQVTKFEVYRYDSSTNLISGWDSLLKKIEDDLNVLESMKLSEYSGKFLVQIKKFEEKLEQISQVLNTWFEAQRQWIYLYGIFKNKQDITSLMPSESSKFENISFEFTNLLLSVLNISIVLNIVDIPDITISIRRIFESLSNVQKSLIGYLENQREIFPRFYFIGNDDLLELIGNSTDIILVDRHIKKIFSGISSIILDDESMSIIGVKSIEGESLMITTPVCIENTDLIGWLSELEKVLKITLSRQCVNLYSEVFHTTLRLNDETVLNTIEKNSNQCILLVFQIYFTSVIERCQNADDFCDATNSIEIIINILKNLIKRDLILLHRVKVENLLIQLIHIREVVENIKDTSAFADNFSWFSEQKFYFNGNDILNVTIKQGNNECVYGYEYLGCPKMLAYTPLLVSTLTLLSEAMDQNLGGLLLGPAGTGKTESVKALGYSLGRAVFVFCCDESFDVESVSRILIGISQVGSFGCFDEFNRLNEKSLSAISTQIEKIQTGMRPDNQNSIEILGRKLSIHKHTGIFITNNPNYEGRSVLPDNLKTRFLSCCMMSADSEVIAKVLLTTQGFVQADKYCQILVNFFLNLKEKCSAQNHYDFGLRNIKYAIVHAGKLNRIQSNIMSELQLIQKCLYDVVLPKLVSCDEPVFYQEIAKLNCEHVQSEQHEQFKNNLRNTAKTDGYSNTETWITKCMQIFEIQSLNHGFMLVGPSCSGKTSAFHTFLKTLNDGCVSNECHRLDAKVMDKALLFGKLEHATREWTDGVFTAILRKACQKQDDGKNKIVWIIFDGEIDPYWVENLNSVLDDNKILTLPNGERIPLANNVKIVFETDNLNHVTPATVSRCGIITFNLSSFSFKNTLHKKVQDFRNSKTKNEIQMDRLLLPLNISIDYYKEAIVNVLYSILDDTTLGELIACSKKYNPVLESSEPNAVMKLIIFVKQTLKMLTLFVQEHSYLARANFDRFLERKIMLSIFWSFCAGFTHNDRVSFSNDFSKIKRIQSILDDLKYPGLVNVGVELPKGDWIDFGLKVEKVSLQPHMLSTPGIVIPTADTYTYELLIHSIIDLHEPILLFGPPGSGKTMLLLSTIRKSQELDLLMLNFSKETTISSIIKSLEQVCNYKKFASETIMSPKAVGKWLVLFCDEVNLPKPDEYETQTVAFFLRQIVVENGFWHPRDRIWIRLKNIQFVGACNPVSITGRSIMPSRFTNYCTTIMVDYPSKESLIRIYNVYSTAVLRCTPDLMGYSDVLSTAMIEVYLKYKTEFLSKEYPHYICSPRELSRWIQSLHVALKSVITLELKSLIRLWAHEALRIFSDRLMLSTEKEWVFNMIFNVAKNSFPHMDIPNTLSKPILFSDWLNMEYQSVNECELKEFVKRRFNVFNEEESNVNITLYDDLLDHALRIDRILKNPQGHMVLVGPNGSGKSTLVKFVSWMNGISIFQLNVSSNFGILDFENILKDLLIRAGVKSERLCFLIDESTILEDSFLEIMNTLLANSEVPGLFEGDEYVKLIESCTRDARNVGLIFDSDDEAYQWFTKNISQNLHVIFTMSDPYSAGSKAFISSSALYNRCVVNWIGTWSKHSLTTVALDITSNIPINRSDYVIKDQDGKNLGLREVVIGIFVGIHDTISRYLDQDISPSLFLHLLRSFTGMFVERENYLQGLYSHVTKGLDHLKETFLKVKQLGKVLAEKEAILKLEDEKAKKLLDKMITDQNESERKQDMSLKMQELFANQEKAIIKRRATVVSQLTDVELLIEEAQKGVMNIKKQHLTELRSMHNPPETIKMVLESICILLGYSVSSWRDVQHVIRQDDFIASIIGFQGEKQLTIELVEYMEREYLSKSNFNFESANRASKACGPLLMWVRAQLKFSSIVVKVAPLKLELKKLEDELIDTKAKLIAIDGLIKDLQEEVEKYKAQYSETIRITENIKTEMKTVKQKIDRSVGLLSSLKLEKERWELNISDYEQKRNYLIGDTILAAAFVTYSGYFTPSSRFELMKLWKRILEDKCVSFSSGYNGSFRISSLESVENIMKWQSYGLPNDEQFLSNIEIMTSNFNGRYVFIVDPTESVIPFITKLVEGNKKSLVLTSFMDPGFIKKLENCVKFGGSILIENGELFDPILNRLIAKDIRMMGAGREMIKIGEKELDISPSFKLYIHTKDPSIELHPFIKSTMCILNFTYTSESLINEALNLTLKIKEPEVESKRLEIIKINNQCKNKLRSLENELLALLSNSKDNILNDDKLLSQLELIKKETKYLEMQMKESETMMNKYNAIRKQFQKFAEMYSKVSEVLLDLVTLDQMYQFSSSYLKSIFSSTLKDNPNLSVNALNHKFIENTYKFTSISILQKHKDIFANSLIKLANAEYTNNNFGELNLNETILSNQYIILRTSKGNDSSSKIEEFCRSINYSTKKFALGSNDGSIMANKLLMDQSDNANIFIIVENIEMSNDFLTSIIETLKLLKAKRSPTKIILTCKIGSSLPVLLLHSCKQIMIETENNVKNNMSEIMLVESSSLNIHKLVKLNPVELKRIMFFLSWGFSLLLWNAKNEENLTFNDLQNAARFIKKYISLKYNQGENHFRVNSAILEVIDSMITQLIFGGKLNKTTVQEIKGKLLNVNMFEKDEAYDMFSMIGSVKTPKLIPPKGHDVYEYSNWIKELPEITNETTAK